MHGKEISVGVVSCQRCGKDHPDMKFKELLNPADKWTHFGMCPGTDQPVLLMIRCSSTIPPSAPLGSDIGTKF